MCVQVGASDLPVIGQIANGVDYLQSELGTAISAFKGVYSAYEDAFCTPASYTPPVLMPANLTGGSPTLWHHTPSLLLAVLLTRHSGRILVSLNGYASRAGSVTKAPDQVRRLEHGPFRLVILLHVDCQACTAGCLR